MKVNLPSGKGGEVIRLEVVREQRRHAPGCQHHSVLVNVNLAQLQCDKCKALVNPVEWLAQMIEEWHRIADLTLRYKEAEFSYLAKQRCRCDCCGKMTKVRPATPAQVREYRRKP